MVIINIQCPFWVIMVTLLQKIDFTMTGHMYRGSDGWRRMAHVDGYPNWDFNPWGPYSRINQRSIAPLESGSQLVIPRENYEGPPFASSKLLNNDPPNVQPRTGINQESRSTNSASNDERIVFPDSQFQIKVPERCKNQDYCENMPNYPYEHIKEIISKTDPRIFVTDKVEPSLEQRFNFGPDEQPLCRYTEKIVYPHIIKNNRNEWLFTVNLPNASQGFRVEECSEENSQCDPVMSVRAGYTSMCRQKSITRNVYTIENDKMIATTFALPSCCSCVVISKSDNDDD